jgi:hypothetical protein
LIYLYFNIPLFFLSTISSKKPQSFRSGFLLPFDHICNIGELHVFSMYHRFTLEDISSLLDEKGVADLQAAFIGGGFVPAEKGPLLGIRSVEC